jgi:hypothetical protein
MSDLAKQLFDGLKAVGQGAANTFVNDVLPDIAAQAHKTISLGATEIAAALHSGNAFVLYGSNQHAPQSAQEPAKEQEHAHEQERGGMSR